MNIYFQLLNQHLIKSNRNIHTGKLDGTLKTIFGKYLLVTNTVSCGLLMATGDTIQQNIEKYRAHKSKPFDWKRTGRMFIIGLVEGPPQHLFYKLLDRNIPNRDFKSILKKIILDQLIASPTCISIFLFGMGLLEGQTWETTVTESKAKFIKIYQVDWLVWPPSQFVNFYFVSPKFRVLFVNCVTSIYDTFLSYMKHDV